MMESILPRNPARKRHRRDGPATVHDAGRVNGHSGALPSAPRGAKPWHRIAAKIAIAAVALAALVSLSALASSGSQAERVAVVMDRSVAQDPARRAAATEWLQAQGAADIAPRIANSPTQQLAVTSALATRGYDVIVAVGLDKSVAIDPVVAHHPDLRVVSR
jgi:basic membrane lipoprotein Med (substrate-binding protein (PBP1-ABC) superfamily)